MDLNLLDSCIYHFVQGVQPALGSGNQCSVVRQLTDILDRNGDATFDIFDVDQCIKDFLTAVPCDLQSQSCSNSQTYCASDAACGEGLFCNPDMHRCERECGFIPDRAAKELPYTDRQCTARLQTCDYERGKCKGVSLVGATCQLDRDCPVGAYCSVGQCQPRCYRTLDCPDSNWFCSSVDNTCQPKPQPSSGGPVFNPKDYSIVYARDSVQLDPFQNQYAVPLLIMNVKTGVQVFSDPQVVFGYRLEAKYQLKGDAKCAGDLSLLSQTNQEDCIISPDEEFLTLGNPYGTLLATGDPSTALRVNDAAANQLSPGSYPVVISAYFTNGQSTSVRVTFKKPSPSGEYSGRLSAYLGSPEALLATTNVAMKLYIRTPEEDPSAQTTNWNALQVANNLQVEKEFQDITEGYAVTGYIHAAESLLFDKPTAALRADNEIPVKGLYSPKLGRLRLIAAIDLPQGTCRNSAGKACTGAANEWQASNAFGRNVRRIIEFIGPFRAAERTFEGIYRETISGLAPNTFTVEGGFRMTQLSQNSQAISLPAPLLVTAGTTPFPVNSTLIDTLTTQMTQACGTTTATSLGSAAAVDTYLANYGKPAQVPAFPATQFSDLIRNTVGCIGVSPLPAGCPVASPTTVSLTEFMAGKIKFCSPTVTTDCVAQAPLLCGLAFMRRAQLAGWFDPTALGRDASGQSLKPALFCSPALATCADPTRADARGAVMLQSQARFYRELVQTYIYQANAAWSDGFYALYKASAQASAPFGTSDAFTYKEAKLREVLKNYDAARDLMLSAPATAALFAWPMNRFQTQGDAWLRPMQTALSDRLDSWLEFADLERRVMQTADLDKTFTFAKHIVNQDYLSQVMLAELQRQWQGLNFSYAGEAASVLARGDVFLAKLSDSRNPLGLSPDRVFFENSRLPTGEITTNWLNYRSQLDTQLPAVKASVQAAVSNLQGALGTQSALQSGLLQTQQGRDASLDELCGLATVDPPACRVSPEDKALATSCVGSSCPYAWKCDTSDETGACATVVKLFSSAVDNVSCRSDVDANKYVVAIKGASNTIVSQRSCNHGKVGALLQERVKLDLERKNSKQQVESLLRQIASAQKALADTRASNQDMVDYLKAQRSQLSIMEGSIAVANTAFDVASTFAKAADCLIIVGLANGTDCPQKIVSAGLTQGLLVAKNAVVSGLQVGIGDMARAKEIRYQEKAGDTQVRELRQQLDNLVANIENIIAQYQLQTQQLYNLDLQVSDTLKTAQSAADRFGAQTADVVSRLLGTDSSQTLRANEMIRDSDKQFRDLLVVTYKMTRAFLHRYNFADKSEVWTNRVYKLLTVPDVEKLRADLSNEEQTYCGSQGIDCDSINNRQVFRFSMREQLFPQLKDIIDPATGNVLGAGQQFHNLITSSAYRHRRVGQSGIEDRIEIPFSIWANDLGSSNSAPRRMMLPSNECNHVIVADRTGNNGTFAVNVSGTRVDPPRIVQYSLSRGGTDDLRSCDPAQILVNHFQVGSPVIESSAGTFFQTRTNTFSACMQSDGNLENPALREQAVGCWNYFARDRSLAAPDYVFVIPVSDQSQQWIVGKDPSGLVNLPESQKGVIEDIRIYFRYNARVAN